MAKPFKLRYPDPNEDRFGEAVANLLDAILRPEEAIYTHIGHGGYHLSPAARGRLQRLGLKPGVPDIVIAYKPGRTLWLELKTATGKLSLHQQQKHAQLFVLCHNVVTLKWSQHWAEDLISVLQLHGVPYRQSSLDRSYHGQDVAAEASGTTESATQGNGSVSSTKPGSQTPPIAVGLW